MHDVGKHNMGKSVVMSPEEMSGNCTVPAKNIDYILSVNCSQWNSIVEYASIVMSQDSSKYPHHHQQQQQQQQHRLHQHDRNDATSLESGHSIY